MKKVLLDENLPSPLKKHFSDQLEVYTTHELGWASKKNGELIRSMLDINIEFLITVDRNLEYQQNLKKYPIRLVVLLTHTNRYKDLADKVIKIETAILTSDAGESIIKVDLR